MPDEPVHNILYTDADVSGQAIKIVRLMDPEILLITANEAGMRQADDHVHFEYAIRNNYVLVTVNVQDFRPLFVRWLEQGHDHPGIIFVTSSESQHPYYLAEMLVLAARVPMINKEEWL